MGFPKLAVSESSRGLAARRTRGRVFAETVLALLGVTSVAPAQERAAPEAPSGLVRGWSDAARALERPASPEDQLRAVERLGAAGNQRALDALILAVATHLSEGRGGGVVQGPSAERGRLRIALARALSAYAERPDARRSLGRLMTGVLGGADARDQLAAGIAATSLARSGDADALEALGRALTQSAPLADIARAALLAHPPLNLEALLRGAPPSRAQIELLAELGDQRAFLPLREIVRSGPEALRGPAALALFRLGALETQAYARYAFQKSRIPSERLAALQILVEAKDELAGAALAAVLSGKDDLLALDPSVERTVVELAALAPRPEWQSALVAKAQSEDPTVRDQALLALARLGGPAEFFGRALSGKDAAWAARALASSSAPSLDAVLTRALADRAARPWALRALSVRLRRGASEPARSAFERAAAQALDDGAPVEKAAAAWALAVASPERAGVLLTRKDDGLQKAVLRQAFNGPLALAAARELQKAKPEEEARFVPLAACLLDAQARGGLSTQLLAALPERGAATFPAVAGAIAERQGEEAPLAGAPRARIEDVRRWLASLEPELRAATARGLGDSHDSASVGLLAELYRFESDPRVRRAAVRALAKRPEHARLRTLGQAVALDPDAAVRALAALAPSSADASANAPTLVWLAKSEGPVRLSSAWGETMVAFPDPDGFVGVLDFGPGPIATTPAPLSEAPVAKLRSARDPSP